MRKKAQLNVIEKLFKRAGKWYPLLVLVIMQGVNSPLVILLTAMPAQQNAEFTASQGMGLLIFGSVTILIRNIALLLKIYFGDKDMFSSLSSLLEGRSAIKIDPGVRARAWKQAGSFTKRYVFFEFIGGFLLVMLPTLLYGYFKLQLTYPQVIYLILATVAASLVNFIMEVLILDRWLAPVVRTLMPKKFEEQINGLQGLRLSNKMVFSIAGLVMIGLLLIIPAAYHQINHFAGGVSSALINDSLLIILNAGMGAIVVGFLIIVQLISYIVDPINQMIRIFQKVEKGDFGERVEITTPDEYGRMDVYLNNMTDRLHLMTSSLEKQVAERTAQLTEVNDQLQIELTERQRIEEQLAYNALHDPLTDLPNRALFMDRLGHVMKRARRRNDHTYAVIFLDLDRFKVVNDSLGHNIGDLMLQETARRLLKCVRGEDTVARLGGDEFVVLLEELENEVDHLKIAERIQEDLSTPAYLGNYKVFTSVSIGIALGNSEYEEAEEIIRNADIAMYQAKRTGRGRYAVFSPVMLEKVKSSLALESDFRKALERKEFRVYYQPVVDLSEKRIIGFEALVRWQHPTQGLLLPAEFISMAEETGLIIPMGYWVLDEACRQLRIWQKQYKKEPPLKMNVNLSTRQCAEKDLVENIAEILKKHELDASNLNLELTESLIVEDPEKISAMLSELRQLGIQILVDDFGTGYSSLSYLNKLPIDTLKIDQTFISQLGINESGLEIVRTILALAHGLGMEVVAEGVETDDQLSKLLAMKCDYMQGFLFARPIDGQEAGALIEKTVAEFDD